MTIEDDVKYLLQSDQYCRVVKEIHGIRESFISDLKGKTTEELQACAGAIAAIDDVLALLQADIALSRVTRH